MCLFQLSAHNSILIKCIVFSNCLTVCLCVCLNEFEGVSAQTELVFVYSYSICFRMNPICSKTQLGHVRLQTLSVCSCIQMIVPFSKRSCRLYLVPFDALQCGLRSFGADSLSGVRGRYPRKHVISGVLDPEVLQRYKVT